jgi:chromosome segregation ATPase
MSFHRIQSRSISDVLRFRSFHEAFEHSRKFLFSVLILRTRDRLSQLESLKGESDTSGDSFWSDFELVIQHHEARMTALAKQASELEAQIASRQHNSSSTHIKRMSRSRAELSKLKQEIESVTAEIEQLEPFRQQKDVQSQIQQTDHQIKETNRVVKRLRQSNNELKVRLEKLLRNSSRGSEAMKRKRLESETKVIVVVNEIENIHRNIEKLDDELEELEIREEACRLLKCTLRPRNLK